MNFNTTYKRLLFALIPLFVFLILLTPVISSAALVPCSNTPVNGEVPKADACDFYALMALINNIIKFILFALAIPICAIMFCYAGFLLVTAGGEAAHARQKAKSIFMDALIGLVLAFAAWLIIRTLLSVLGYNGDWIFKNF